MPLTSHCKNCGFPKDPAQFADDYCTGCQTAINEAQQAAAAEGTMSQTDAKRLALATRAHNAHRNRPDPRTPFNRSDTWDAALRARQEIEAGSVEDPRRGS